MRFFSQITVFILFCLLTCCASEAPVYKADKVRVWTDVFTEEDGEFFKSFERKHRIAVEITHLSVDEILDRLKKDGLNTPVDVLLLADRLDMEEFSKASYLYQPQQFDTLIAPLIHEPIVFAVDKDFALDVHPLTGYSQWLQEDKWYMDTSQLSPRSYRTWLKGMAQLYGIKSDSVWQNKIYSSDRHIPFYKKVFQQRWYTEAQRDSIIQVVIPNQDEGGAITRTWSLAIVQHAFNMQAACEFRAYCENPKWKRWMAVRNKIWVAPFASRQPIQKISLNIVKP